MIFSIFNRLNKITMPREYKFRGYLDLPQDYERTNIVAGWYFSKKPFYKVVACLDGEEIIELKPNTVRKDVAREHTRKKFQVTKKSGFTYSIDQNTIAAHLKNKLEKRSNLSVRFYIDKNKYAEKFKTPFVLRGGSRPPEKKKQDWRGIISAFLPKQRNVDIPENYYFTGHLDLPKDDKLSNIIAGWYLTKVPFFKVVACLNGMELLNIERMTMRKDVTLLHNDYDCVDKEKSGFHVQIPDSIIKNLLRGRNKREVKASIRFYLDRSHYAEKFCTEFVLYGNEYDLFFKEQEAKFKKLNLSAIVKKLKHKPKLSVIVPVYRPSREHFIQMAQSVLNQAYPYLELCVCFDGRQPELENILKGMKDSRVRVAVNEKNKGISAATNRALKLATGEFAAFVDHDDIIHKFALFEIIRALNKRKDIDLIYTDEDKVDGRGRHFMPYFKPDHSPHQLLCNNYMCHLVVARKSIVDSLGGLRENAGIEGSQDWDLILRILEKTKNVLHVPKVLYSWRYYDTSVSQIKRKKEEHLSASKKVLSDYIRRNGLHAKVKNGLMSDTYKVDHEITGDPKVSIIMPTGGKLDLLTTAVDSVLKKTSYPNFEIVIVDNSVSKGKKETEVKKALKKFRSGRIRYFRYALKPFNFSALINFGASKAKGQYLLLLNDDMEVINRDWMTEMLKVCQQKNVGAVGAKLYYGNDTIQHVGVIFGLFDIADHVFKGKDRNDPGYFNSNYLIKEHLAVTGACLMTPKSLFWKMKGLDGKNLKVAYQDIDYCLKLYEKGYYTVFTPYAELYHYEGLTKTVCVAGREFSYFTKKWAKYIKNDPFYNPNLSKNSLEYYLDIQ